MNLFSIDVLTWLGIVACVLQSAMFSGLNLALFSIPRLTLEIDAQRGDTAAQKVLAMRQDSNRLLTTILWGNVGTNVLLTLLSESILAGVSAFLFSTVVITFVGEICPQAYFSRHAMKMAAKLSPLLQIYLKLLYPVAGPVAWILDQWLGKEGIQWYRERDLRAVIRKHVESAEAHDVELIEGVGALNFLAIDDLSVASEGEIVDPDSVICLPVQVDLPVFPVFKRVQDDPFMKRIQASDHKWVILCGPDDTPLLVLDADGFLRSALFSDGEVDPYAYCHCPILITNPDLPLGEAIWRMKQASKTLHGEVIDKDIVLLWTATIRRVITGADLLGRLLRGVDA